jgi:hypothetical protein
MPSKSSKQMPPPAKKLPPVPAKAGKVEKKLPPKATKKKGGN